MSKSDEVVVDSLVRLVGAVCSVRLSLGHWITKKAFGEPIARFFVQHARLRASCLRKQVWSELKALPAKDLIRLLQMLLPHKSRRRFLTGRKKEFAPLVKRLAEDFKKEFEKGVRQFEDQNMADRQPLDERLYPELQCDLNTLCAEPWRAEKSFPMEILKSPREQRRLRSELPSDEHSYGQQLNTFLYQVAADPFSLALPPRRTNDLLFKVVKQQPSANLTVSHVARALGRLFVALGESGEAKAMFEHLIGRILRHEFGLSRDRNTVTFSQVESEARRKERQVGAEADDEPWEPEDSLSMRGYEEIDWRLEYEALRDGLPPEQRKAVERYLEAKRTGDTIDDVCNRYGDNPVTVRNNFHEVKRKASMGKL